jgi:hypothetical protein
VVRARRAPEVRGPRARSHKNRTSGRSHKNRTSGIANGIAPFLRIKKRENGKNLVNLACNGDFWLG